jgi:hypothetical protein
MSWQPNSLRKAVERSQDRREQLPPTRPVIDKEAIIKESREQYRGFVESINRSSDKDIERALSR